MDDEWDTLLVDNVNLVAMDSVAMDSTKPEAHEQAQQPTPPHSVDGSPLVDENGQLTTLVSVSTEFFPGARHNGLDPDVVLLATDSVFFYVHSQILLEASDNQFRQMLPVPSSRNGQPFVMHVSDSSAILNIILHTIYDLSVAHYSPSFETLSSAIGRFPVYGISPKTRIIPSSPLFALLMSHAPLRPMDVYSLAATYDMFDLAQATSAHLLSLSLSTITDEVAEQMGAVYLKRLFFLHFGRAEALKRALTQPPHPHPPTRTCDFAEQKRLTRAWTLATAYLAWDSRPDLSPTTIESSLHPLADLLTCEDCRRSMLERTKALLVQWSLVKIPVSQSASHLQIDVLKITVLL
ncbi:hypothetical protein FISHEDRAFT_64148 [Fistulina hepatica ATCC 64428]|uniref:BTB domain-containing protein n=1 Tax=Fistulina hepatica ATCC 64428 TaxID=1128425 RepID=A0A0D7AIC9_9AGAR|nr:hypothetical protein FISHEDRAFT_64148 [Fistulina hepatica ATCC 64428]